MNKEKFLKSFIEETGFSSEQAQIINNIFENHFIIGKNNKEKILFELEKKLDVSSNAAEDIYNSYIDIVIEKLKDRINHPFGD